MSKITKVSVSYSAKMTMEYQSISSSAGLDIELEDDEKASDVVKFYHKSLRDMVNKDIQKDMTLFLNEVKTLQQASR